MKYILIFCCLGLAACQTVSQGSTAQMQAQIDKLEYELAKMKKEEGVSSSVNSVAADGLMETYQTVQQINQSTANDVSALKYVRGSYGSDVTVYPLDANKVPTSRVLQERTEDYPRHIMQLGQDVFSTTHSTDVIVYPLRDPYEPNPEAEAFRAPEPKAQQTTAPRLTSYGSDNDVRRESVTSNNPRRLTGY